MKLVLPRFFQKNLAAKGAAFAAFAFLCGLFNSQLVDFFSTFAPIWNAAFLCFAAAVYLVMFSIGGGVFLCLMLATTPFLLIAMVVLCRQKQTL